MDVALWCYKLIGWMDGFNTSDLLEIKDCISEEILKALKINIKSWMFPQTMIPATAYISSNSYFMKHIQEKVDI